eukprot:gene16951-biopygen3348
MSDGRRRRLCLDLYRLLNWRVSLCPYTGFPPQKGVTSTILRGIGIPENPSQGRRGEVGTPRELPSTTHDGAASVAWLAASARGTQLLLRGRPQPLRVRLKPHRSMPPPQRGCATQQAAPAAQQAASAARQAASAARLRCAAGRPRCATGRLRCAAGRPRRAAPRLRCAVGRLRCAAGRRRGRPPPLCRCRLGWSRRRRKGQEGKNDSVHTGFRRKSWASHFCMGKDCVCEIPVILVE